MNIEEFASRIILGPSGMDSFEAHEMVIWRRPERVEAAIWAIKCLANPACEGSEEALQAILERRAALGERRDVAL